MMKCGKVSKFHYLWRFLRFLVSCCRAFFLAASAQGRCLMFQPCRLTRRSSVLQYGKLRLDSASTFFNYHQLLASFIYRKELSKFSPAQMQSLKIWHRYLDPDHMPRFSTSFPDEGEKKTTSIPTDFLDEVMHITGVGLGIFCYYF